MNVDEADTILKALDRKKIIAGSKDKMDSAIMESMSNERAAHEPLPGPATYIFNVEPLTVKISTGEEITIRPMVSFDINIFKTINSPFYEIIMQTEAKEAMTKLFTSEEESYEMIYQFTHSPKQIYYLFKKGLEVFKDAVMEEVAFKYNPADAALLVSKIMEHIFQVQLARVNFESAPEPEGGENKKKEILQQTSTTTS
jgi:hypothetical protein